MAVDYTHGERRRKIALCDAADVGLAAVRERAEAERVRVAVGEDPRLALLAREQQQAEELARVLALKETEALDLNAMVDAWMADAVVRANDNKALRQASDKHILPKLGPTGAAQYGW